MFYTYQNLKQKFGQFYFFGDRINSIQFMNLAKHNLYPHLESKIMKNVSTNIIINSGKLMIDMKKLNENRKIVNQKILFAENNILYETDKNNDIVLTNKKYIITILPNIYYSFYSYDSNTNFNLFYMSNNNIKLYTEHNNSYCITSYERLI